MGPRVYRSLRDFLLGIVRRFYFWVFAFVLEPWDLVERFIPMGTRQALRQLIGVDVPQWLFWAWLGIGVAVAVFMTYHELHTLHANRLEIKTLKDSLGMYLLKLKGLQQRCVNFTEDPAAIEAEVMSLSTELIQFFQVHVDVGELGVFSTLDVTMLL